MVGAESGEAIFNPAFALQWFVLKLIWNWKLFPELCCTLPQLSTSYATQIVLSERMKCWFDENRTILKCCAASTSLPACLLHIFFKSNIYCLYLIILNSFHKESLLDPDDSAAGDCRDHLHFYLLVRHHYTREFLPKWAGCMSETSICLRAQKKTVS